MEFRDIFSLSTAWNVSRHHNGKALIDEILSIGFHRVELNYNVTKEMAEEILPMVEKGKIVVSSVHNVFPRISDAAFGTDSLLLGYPDPTKRKQAVALTIEAVEYADRFHAQALVIHPGEVLVPKDYNRLLEDLIMDGRRDSPEYAALYQEMIQIRESGSPAYVELIRQSLEEISDHIVKKGYKVALGLENRTRCYQIPVFHEVHTLLNALKGLPVYFWYDVGHGMLLEQMGMFDNYREASAIIDKTIGVHIHDIIGCSDHYCPYQYSEKLDQYLGIIQQIPIKVFEIGRDSTGKEIKTSAEIMAAKLDEQRKRG